jgi:hypothetical protein
MVESSTPDTRRTVTPDQGPAAQACQDFGWERRRSMICTGPLALTGCRQMASRHFGLSGCRS